jgi:hypothetical protein
MALRFTGNTVLEIELYLKWLGWAIRQPQLPSSSPGFNPNTLSEGGFHWPEAGTKENALAFLLSSVSMKIAATNMSNKQSAQEIVAAADRGISQLLDSDDICPPWPYPGPPIPLINLASELTFIANTVQEGSLRTAILGVAGQGLDRAYAVTTQVAAP